MVNVLYADTNSGQVIGLGGNGQSSLSLNVRYVHHLSLYCNMYTYSGNCIQEGSVGFPIFSLITLLTLITLIVLQSRSYMKAR